MSVMSAPERLASWAGATIRENFKAVVAIVVAIWLAVMWGVISLPAIELPLWARVLGTFGAVSGLAGYMAASMYYEEPEPDWNWIVEVNFDAEWFIRIAKVTDPVVADFRTVKGRLRRAPGSSIYYCRWWNHDINEPIAHASWKDLPDDAELLGTKPSAIVDEVRDLRDSYERTHGKHKWVVNHLYMVVRKLDFRRSKSQNAVLEEHVSPSMEDESISDVVDDVVPEHIRPDNFDAPESSGRDGISEEAVDDLEDELEESAVDEVGAAPATATDGGQTDE